MVIPHVSQHLGEQLESLVLSCSPGKIELERSVEEIPKDMKTGAYLNYDEVVNYNNVHPQWLDSFGGTKVVRHGCLVYFSLLDL